MQEFQLKMEIEVKEVPCAHRDGGNDSYYVRVCVNEKDSYFILYTDEDNGTAESSHYNQKPETYDSLKEVSMENALYYVKNMIYKIASNLAESFLDSEMQ